MHIQHAFHAANAPHGVAAMGSRACRYGARRYLDRAIPRSQSLALACPTDTRDDGRMTGIVHPKGWAEATDSPTRGRLRPAPRTKDRLLALLRCVGGTSNHACGGGHGLRAQQAGGGALFAWACATWHALPPLPTQLSIPWTRTPKQLPMIPRCADGFTRARVGCCMPRPSSMHACVHVTRACTCALPLPTHPMGAPNRLQALPRCVVVMHTRRLLTARACPCRMRAEDTVCARASMCVRASTLPPSLLGAGCVLPPITPSEHTRRAPPELHQSTIMRGVSTCTHTHTHTHTRGAAPLCCCCCCPTTHQYTHTVLPPLPCVPPYSAASLPPSQHIHTHTPQYRALQRDVVQGAVHLELQQLGTH
jgi:hypothetical protein